MEEYSNRSLISQSSQGSLEDEYIQVLHQLSTVFCVDPEEAVNRHLTSSLEVQLSRVESEMFSEPPEPYFTMNPDDFEMVIDNSASVEALKIETSNVG